MTLAVTPLNDVGLWARSNLLVVILLIIGVLRSKILPGILLEVGPTIT